MEDLTKSEALRQIEQFAINHRTHRAILLAIMSHGDLKGALRFRDTSCTVQEVVDAMNTSDEQYKVSCDSPCTC